ncbi:MAG TPA: tRNA guanosine(34) transglycosylase Tgt [Patescibacteria group bacterium]|nr:tRNA guanosine(34) transglycosylase Tgt [Patescibacteria group bacterium]
MSAFGFELLATDGAARRGRLTTPHGVVDTPAFMPVGTQGTVKSLSPDDVREAGAQILLGNTYHLLLRPGPDLVRELGGLHRFMAWDGPILTDSGGFQVFSLAKLRKLTEAGAEFRSPLDGATHFLSPERAVEIQCALGSDIMHPLDECLAYPATREQTERSLALTLRWAQRSLAAHRGLAGDQALFGIVQGGSYPDLRARAVAETVALGFAGYAIGGMAVGEPKPMMRDLTEAVARALPADQPRYLMGVGKPEDLVESVARGVDMFDCVLPTRNARNGQCFTPDGPLTLKQARFTRDPAPLQEDCPCYACRRFSRAYLRHLFMADELLVYRLLSLHNLHFFLGLMTALRAAIAAGAFEAFRTRFFARYSVSSVPVPLDDSERPEV